MLNNLNETSIKMQKTFILKRIEKGISKENLENWFYKLKKLWVKNYVMVNFLNEFEKELLEKGI